MRKANVGARTIGYGLLLLGCGAAAAGAKTGNKIADFEGIEEPKVVYHPSTKTFTDDAFVNITDVPGGGVRFALRYNPAQDWWDGDRTTTNDDRQRAEVKGLGPHQDSDDTFRYSFDFRTNPEFKGTGSFCHIFQLKATNGDDGAPLVTLSLRSGNEGRLQVWSGTAAGSTVARTFKFTPNQWSHVDIEITTSLGKTGSVLASIDGDALTGISNTSIYRPDATDYRPKWGFYRGVNTGLHAGEDWIEERNFGAAKVTPEPAVAGTAIAGTPLLLRRRRRR